MPEASNRTLVRLFLPVEKPKMTIVYENEILINIDLPKNFIYHFIHKDLWSIGASQLEPSLFFSLRRLRLTVLHTVRTR
jgi:hypothetical protein